jgi:hypothetical protein
LPISEVFFICKTDRAERNSKLLLTFGKKRISSNTGVSLIAKFRIVMSKKLYDYSKCHEIAKQCSCSSEMQKLNPSAYNAARQNKWLNNYTWFKKKRHEPYVYEDIYEIAKNYTCSSDFQKGNGSAYAKARENGWIKDYTWFTAKQHAPYTYEECYEVAQKFKSRRELALGNVGVYQAALNHGWLDDYTWFETRQNPFNYWTKERVIEESKKYKNRGEFHDKCGTAYGKARINGWLDELTWLKDDRIDFSIDRIDCVYAYEFVSLKAVYVGRTLMRRINSRIEEHLSTETDAVYIFAKENSIPVPEMKILEDHLTLAEGVSKEGVYLDCYKEDGWKILNRAKTGGIGTIARNKWSKRKCQEEALKYKTRSDFALHSGSAYEVARSKGWLEDYTWFVEKKKPAGYWDNYERCYDAASKCRTKTEFIKNYLSAYISAKEHGWIERYTWFNIKRTAYNKKWDYNTVFEEAKKYTTKKDFGTSARGAYKVALANGWMPLYDWFEETSVVHRRACKARKKKWTYEACKQLASISKGRKDFRMKSGGAYEAAWRNKWLDDLFPKTDQ